MTSLGHALNLSVVAEGIETAEESQHIRTLGCEVGQGYYFAKPLPTMEADTFLRQHGHRATWATIGSGVDLAPARASA